MDFCSGQGGLDSVPGGCSIQRGSGSLLRNLRRCSWWRLFGVLFFPYVVFCLLSDPLVHSLSPLSAVDAFGFASKALVSLWGDKFPETARQKGALPTNPQDCSPYISLQNKSRENVSRSRHFPVGDHFVSSCNLFL